MAVWCQDLVRNVDQQNEHLKAECQAAMDQLSAHSSIGRNSRPSSYMAAISADEDACVQSADDQTSD